MREDGLCVMRKLRKLWLEALFYSDQSKSYALPVVRSEEDFPTLAEAANLPQKPKMSYKKQEYKRQPQRLLKVIVLSAKE